MKFLVSESQFKNVISNIHEQMTQYLLNEGINEDRAIEILKKHLHIESEVEVIFNFLKGIDKSTNNKMLPAIASFYVNADSNEEYPQIVKTFKKLFELTNEKGKPIPPPDVALVSDDEVKILNRTFKTNQFEQFKNFIDHFYYTEDVKEKEDIEKLYDIDANKRFENDRFIIWEAASDKVCIKLFGRDYEGRKYVKRSFCIGWGKSPEKPETHYKSHRTPSGSWGITFYIVMDKEKYEKYLETNTEESSMLNAVGVREAGGNQRFSQKAPFTWNNELEFFTWDENNPGVGYPVSAFGSGEESVGNYIKFLEENGVNIKNVFKPKEYVDYSDEKVNKLLDHQGTTRGDSTFDELTPKQKVKFITNVRKLTPHQTEFFMNEMPLNYLKALIGSIDRLGDFSVDAFKKLSPNLQKTFVRTKLIQLFMNSENFDKDTFFEYMINDDLVNYSVGMIKKSFDDTTNPNRNIQGTMNVLGLLSPEDFIKSFEGQTKILIDSDNFKLSSLPENIGDYLGSATKLTFKNLTNLKSIPQSIGKATNLIELRIINCGSLESIPDSIGELVNLESLDINKNKSLSTIPDSIGNLTKIAHLNLSDNNLSTIPSTISNLKELSLLNLEDNPITSLPVDALKQMEELLFITITVDGETTSIDKDELENLFQS